MRQGTFSIALAITATLACVTARADNTINLIDRTDLRMQMFDDSSGRQSNNQFDVNYLRVDFKGNVTDDMKYRLRIRLDKTTIKDGLKGVSDFANYAFVEPKFNDIFSMRIGKLWTYQGGWEADNSSSDVYVFSGMDDVVSSYQVGVNPTITLDKQKIQFVLTNSDVAYGSDPKSNRYMDYGVAYQGLLLDIVQPLLSFSLSPATGWTKGDIIAVAGVKVDPAPFGGEIDLQYWKNNTAPSSLQPELISIGGTVRFKTVSFAPQLKLFYDMHSTDGTSTGNVFGFAPAIEYFPWADKEFRVHLAYTGRNTAPKGGTSTYDQQVFLGVKGSWGIK